MLTASRQAAGKEVASDIETRTRGKREVVSGIVRAVWLAARRDAFSVYCKPNVQKKRSGGAPGVFDGRGTRRTGATTPYAKLRGVPPDRREPPDPGLGSRRDPPTTDFSGPRPGVDETAWKTRYARRAEVAPHVEVIGIARAVADQWP